MRVASALILFLPAVSAFSPPVQPTGPYTTRTTKLFVDGKGMAGGSQHILGDIIRSLQPRYLSQVANAVQSNVKGMKALDVSPFCEAFEAPTWQEIERLLTQQQTATERSFRDDLEKGRGPPSALATKRLFGQEMPIVTLYRDSAAWCPYCQKVWIALEEKKVPYEIVKIDMRCYGKGKPTEFLKLQPNGNLPCAVINGQQIISESNDIVDALDALGARGTPTLRPAGQEARIKELCDNGRDSLERRLYARWMWWLTGVRKPAEYKQIYEEHLDEVEQALAEATGGPFFLGKEISVVDIRFIPFVERQVASFAYFKGYDIRDGSRPNLLKWLEAMEARPSYRATKSDYYTHSRALPPQLAAECVFEAGCEDLQASIDSLPTGDGSSEWVEPGWGWCDPAASRREAVERLVRGHKQITAFCARAAGLAGLPAASAPLADPLATPNDAAQPAIDLILRHVAISLLQSKGNFWLPLPINPKELNLEKGSAGLDYKSAEALADCTDYVRGRIGVSRDMSYPSARALQAELLKVSSTLRKTDGWAEFVKGSSTVEVLQG